MNNQKGAGSTRRTVAHLSLIGTTQLHLRNPYVIAWWSIAFPGLGHLLLSKYLRGFLLFIWELYINYQAHVNLGIFYSLTGRFEMAKEALDINWMLLYMPTYLFAIWDSYRSAVDLNHAYILAAREDAKIKSFTIGAIEINYLDKRKPWISVAWSIMMPGAGQVYIHRIATAFFVLVWWIVVVYYSKALPAVHYTFLGDFEQAKNIINRQWFMNIPSIYFFAIYDAYVNTVENNKLYDWEQAKFFKSDYQAKAFTIPLKQTGDGGQGMYIVSTFEHSKYLELAITAIQMKGIPKEKILAVPLDKRSENRQLFDTMHQADGMSLLDLPAILGTAFSLVLSIYGFILKWGPILWGLIGFIIGVGLGLIIKLFIVKRYSNRQQGSKGSEVVLIIECKDWQLEEVKNTLWEHFALGVRKLSLD